jgi:tetratricopeptide (TPR) repeat protein
MRTLLVAAALAAACSSNRPPPAAPPTGDDAGPAVVSSITVTGARAPVDASVAPADAAPGADGLYRDAVAAAERNDFAEAARLFGAAYDAAPSLEMAFNAFRMSERSASVDDAARWYDRVIARSPTAAMRADLDQRMGSLRDFARRRREDIARPPPGTDALARESVTFFNRGVALYQRRQYAAALRAFEASLRYMQSTHNEVAELFFNLAVAHEHVGHRAEAVAAFREYLSRRPDTPDRAGVERRIRTLSQ